MSRPGDVEIDEIIMGGPISTDTSSTMEVTAPIKFYNKLKNTTTSNESKILTLLVDRFGPQETLQDELYILSSLLLFFNTSTHCRLFFFLNLSQWWFYCEYIYKYPHLHK